jgi:hypothetical protein
MNSRVTTKDLLNVTAWLRTRENRELLDRVRVSLSSAGGLADLTAPGLASVGKLLESLMSINNIKAAKASKWLAAWAPAHVPMIDRWVNEALTGGRRASANLLIELSRFRAILLEHREVLEELGRWLAARVGVRTIPAVRVLDSLIWFDWWACEAYAADFEAWITSVVSVTGYRVTALGRRCEKAYYC